MTQSMTFFKTYNGDMNLLTSFKYIYTLLQTYCFVFSSQ